MIFTRLRFLKYACCLLSKASCVDSLFLEPLASSFSMGFLSGNSTTAL